MAYHGPFFKRGKTEHRMCSLKTLVLGLPWWLSGEENPCQFRRHVFDLWSGKIQCALEPLSHCSTATEPVVQSPGAAVTEARCLEPALCKKRGHTVTSPSSATGGQVEKNPHDNEDLAQPETRKNINKEKNLFFCLFLLYYHQFSGKRRKKNTKNQLNWNPELPDEPVSIWLETIGMKQ